MQGDSVSPRPSPYRYLVFTLLALAYFLVYFHRTSTGVVSVELSRDLHADPSLLGMLGAAYFYPYALMQLPSGLLTDSWGPRRTITASFLLAGGAAVLFALAQGVGMAIFARVLVGLGVAMLFVPTLKVLTNWFRPQEFARMTGLLMAVGGLGLLCAAGPLAYMSRALGWRTSFLVMGGLTTLVGVAIWLFVRNTPQEKGLPPVNPPREAAGGGQAIGLWEGMKRVLTNPRFWPLAIWFFCTYGVFFSFAALWGGHFLRTVLGLDQTQAGNVLNMLAISLIVGSPLVSWLSDRLRSRKKVLVSCSILMLLLSTQIAFLPDTMTHGYMYVWCFLFSIAAGAIAVIGFTATKEMFPVSMAGTSTGLVNLFPFLGGAVVQWLMGLIIKLSGGQYTQETFNAAFLLYFITAVIGLVSALFIKETFPRAEEG